MPGPPEPFDGLVPIAEYGDKTEADVALAALQSGGFGATLIYDPALNTVAPYFATDRTYELVVRTGEAEAASEALEDLRAGLPVEYSDEHAVYTDSYRQSPRRHWIRRIALVMFLVYAGPFLLATIVTIQLRSR